MSAPMSPQSSPDVFPKTPRRGAGVRRVNRLPLMIGFAVVCLVGGVLVYTVTERADQNAAEQRRSQAKPDPASSAGVFDGAPEAGLIAAKDLPKPPAPEPAEEIVVYDSDGKPTPVVVPATPRAREMYAQEWQTYRQQQQQIRQAQLQAAQAALAAPTSVTEFGKPASDPTAVRDPATKPPASGESAIFDRIAGIAQSAAAGRTGSDDPNNAEEKREWLDSEPSVANYLDSGRQAPLSMFEVKAGTVIPGVMIGGISSDLPGQIIGQVSENVRDTVTGLHVLIPQGSRLIGAYDNQVTRGQRRVLVAWHRVIYPDGSSVDLGSMPGADQAGYAGFKDRVNNHYFRVFGDALLMSLFSAGIQLSQPDSAGLQGGYDSQQIIAGSLGQQLGQTGMQLAQKNTDIQPTLEIRPGFRFVVMVTKDMVLRPWGTPP